MDIASMPAGFIELVRLIGFSAVIFVIWVMTLQFFKHILSQQEKMMTTLIEKQDEQYTRIFEEQSKRNNENFQVLNKFAESIDYMAGRVSEVNSKIENNHFCPIVRKENGQ
jgi:hypothetical protein